MPSANRSARSIETLQRARRRTATLAALLALSASAPAVAGKGPKPPSAPPSPPAAAPPAPPPAAPPAPAAPAISDELRELVRRYGNARPSAFLDVTTDGALLLIGTRFGETRQLHLVDGPLGMRSQETFSGAPILSARFLPQDPAVLLYLQDPLGNQNYQIHKYERRSARATRFTDGTSRHTDLLLARDGRRLAWASNARPGSESDVYVAEAETPASPRRLTELPGRWRPLDFSANGRALLVLHERAQGDAELFEVSIEGGGKKKLWPPDDAIASVTAATFSADGHDLFLVTDRFSDAQELVRLELDHPERPPQRLTAELKWDVDMLAAAQDRGAPAAAAITVNQGGYDRLYLLEPGTFKLMPVSLPPGVVTALRFPTVKSDVLFLGLTSPARPEEIEQLDVRSRRLSRWTRAELGPIDAGALLEPQRAGWSSDGLEIPALIYRPREAAGRLPVLLALRARSGPRPLSRPGFDAVAQLLAGELGIAVISPGLRGTPSQGKKLLGDADPRKLEAQQLADLGAGLDWIAAQPDLDPKRVVLLDEEPGSGLGQAFLAAHPDRLRAALGEAPIDPAGRKSAADEALLKTLAAIREKLAP